MELFRVLFLLLTLLGILSDAASVKQYNIAEEGGADEYIANIPQELEFPPLSQSDPPREFQILSGSDKVSIRSNGDVHTKVRLDRENICPDNPPICEIDVEIGVVENGFQLVKIQLVVDDLNDNTPRFPNDRIEKEISESSSVGALIRLDSAIDPDLGIHSIQRYAMNGLVMRENEESSSVSPSEFPFTLEVIENIDGTKIPQLKLEKKLDREEVSSYELVLSAIDGGNPQLTGTTTVLVSILDANDNPPSFFPSTYVVSVPENMQQGYTIIQLEASDRDHGLNAEIEYTFPSVVSDEDREIFNLDQYTGIISINTELDYENKAIHHLTVEAKDSGSSPASAYATVTVKVLDINDFAPQIQIDFIGSIQSDDGDEFASDEQPKPVLIRENTAIGKVLAFVTVTDKDTGANGNATCRLKDSSTFVMKAVKGGSNRYLISTNQELDREVKRFHSIDIEAWDAGSPSLFSSKTIVVDLFDENDNDPTFAKSIYRMTVRENIRPGESIAILTADDLDHGVNAAITYSAKPQPLDAVVPFKIEPETGAVYFKEGSDPLDAENKTKPFRLIVTATDNGVPKRNATTTLVITVADENDNAPEFKLKNYVFRVREDSPAGLYVGTVSAQDKDVDKNTNGKISYKFQDETTAFSIKDETGEIHFVGDSEDLDREIRQSQPYVFTVIATDHGNTPLTDHCTVDVYIVDINDNPPIVISPNVTKDIFFVYISSSKHASTSAKRLRRSTIDGSKNDLLEGAVLPKNATAVQSLTNLIRIGSTSKSKAHHPGSIPAMITQVVAEDLDEGENGRVRFSIVGGNTYKYFSINPHSGKVLLQIRDKQSLRNMKRGCHVIKISTKDLGKPVQHAFGWANIYVTDAAPGTMNFTIAMRHCMNNSFYPVRFLPPADDNAVMFANWYTVIIIAGSLVAFLLLCCIIFIYVRRRCPCCGKESRSYHCKNSSVMYNDDSYRKGAPLHGGRNKGSVQQMGDEPLDSRTSYVDWSTSQARLAQEKEEMLMHDAVASEGSMVGSHNSGKDSGTGDSMPSDAYHNTAAGMMMHRVQYPNHLYQRQAYMQQHLQPSHVNIPPQDDLITTDEERPSYASSQGMISTKCTNECRIRGHGDHCWMPDSLRKASSRMTSFKGADEFDGGSLKKRSMTPNSYQHYIENMRYANVPILYDSVQTFNDGQPIRGNLASFRDDRNPDVQMRQPPVSVGYQHAYAGHVSQPPYTQSPIPFNTASPAPYSMAQQDREKVHINQHGAVYEANGVGNDEVQGNLSNTSHGNHYQNYPISHNSPQQYYAPEQNRFVQYPQMYQQYDNDMNEQQGYYDDQGQFYGTERTGENEFAAMNLILSPADSEPGDYKRRLEQQINQQAAKPTGYDYGNSSEPENQHLLNNENSSSKPVEDDSSVAKLSTIREEMDADEVVAGIDRLLL